MVKKELKLYDYQQEGVDRINSHLDLPKRKIIYQLPTGGGKTEVAIVVAKEWLSDLSAPDVYWMTHREELEDQSRKRMNSAGLDSAIVTSPIKLNNRIKKGVYIPGPYDLLIADEAHHASARTWRRMIENWPGNVLGLTATPWRMSKHEGLDGGLFDHLIIGPTSQWLIENKYLVPCIIRHPRGDKEIEGFGTDVSGDYNATETFERNDSTVLIEEGIDWLLDERRDNSKTISYCINVKHAKLVNDYANSVGLKSALILGETPDLERKESVDQFKHGGDLNLLVCVEVITEGFDVPGVDSILMQRKTKSLSLYLQMVGRAMRTAPGKTHALILDAASNWKIHGLPEQDRAWTLEKRGELGEPGEHPIRICPMCNTVNHVSSRSCILCDFSFGEECNRCGSFVYKDNQGNKQNCKRCLEEAQKNMFVAGIDTIMAAEPYNFAFFDGGSPDWGAKVFNPGAQVGDIIQLASRDGTKKWQMQIKELVGKSGPSLLVRTESVKRQRRML